MKAGKVAAVALGGGILILQIAQHKGYIRINWEKINKSADKILDKIEEKATGKGPDVVDKVNYFYNILKIHLQVNDLLYLITLMI